MNVKHLGSPTICALTRRLLHHAHVRHSFNPSRTKLWRKVTPPQNVCRTRKATAVSPSLALNSINHGNPYLSRLSEWVHFLKVFQRHQVCGRIISGRWPGLLHVYQLAYVGRNILECAVQEWCSRFLRPYSTHRTIREKVGLEHTEDAHTYCICSNYSTTRTCWLHGAVIRTNYGTHTSLSS